VLLSVNVLAQSFPAKPIRLVVPYPAGTGTDIVARAVSQTLSMRRGFSVVVDNRPGGGTIIGMDIVSKALPDGYTLLMATTSFAIAPGLNEHLPFDPIKDFAPIILMDSAPLLLVVAPGLNVNSLKELLARARSRPDELNYASSGNGGAIHLAMELLKSMADVKLTHIPYKGSPAALVDVLSGRVAVMFNIISSSTPYISSGKLRALAVSGATRSPALPNVPTVAEAGVPGYEAVSWHGLLAPAKTPASVILRLYEEVHRMLQEPGIKQTLESQGFDIRGESPAKFEAFAKSEVVKWTKVVKDSGARVD
jgi:tripartite-type tricarboxylate transporter receptor subunit TctC